MMMLVASGDVWPSIVSLVVVLVLFFVVGGGGLRF